MSEKTVEQKLKDCKEVIIQNMEKTIQHKMVYMFMKDRKREADVKQYSVNSKDGLIKIEFIDHDKAEAFYNEANFIEKILIRPFNIYYNLTLTEQEMKKYYLEGITEENQRKLFETAKKVSPCKLYTSYGSGTRAKLKATGLLSFIRRDPIPKGEFETLSKELQEIGIKIYQYVQEKGTKVSLNLVNFVSDNLYSKEENDIHEYAQDAAKKILNQHAPDVKARQISVMIKKKEILESKNSETKINKVMTSALMEFDTTQTTYAVYEKLRIGLKDEELGRVKLFFHAEENNSYLSLITQGLSKPEGLSEKQFEEVLLLAFRQINKHVIQVNIYPVIYNNTYIGRVYLSSEEEGRNFVVDYSNYRSKIYEFYKDPQSIIFNINIDLKTLRKIKQAEKKAKETEEKIKKQNEAIRRENRRIPNQMPLSVGLGPMGNPMMGGPMMGPGGPNMMMGPGPMGPPPMGPMGNMPPPPNRMEGMMGMPPQFPPNRMPMGPPLQKDLKAKLGTILRDKQRILDMEENQAKRILVTFVKDSIEEQKIASGPESMGIANSLLKDYKVADAFKFLEEPDSLREAALNIKNKN